MDSAPEHSGAAEYVEVLHQIETAEETDVVERALTAARERLGMDAAYITTIGTERQTVEAVVGDAEALGLASGASLPVEQTFCFRMVRGEMPNVVPDTRAEPAIRDLDSTHAIAAYIGVPVTLSDGRVHGTLCCASHTTRAELGGAELGFMKVLAGIVAARVDQVQGDLDRLTARLRSQRPPPG